MSRIDIESQIEPEDQLTSNTRNLLIEHGISLNTWGLGAAKSLGHLVEEIRAGETELIENDSGELVRRLRVVSVDVFYVDEGTLLRLKEDKQVFNEGTPNENERKRKLGAAVQEKMIAGEKPEDSAQRAIAEELNIKGYKGELHIVKVENNTLTSPSYPGLSSQYERHIYETHFTLDEFKAEGYKEVQNDKTTYFVWEVA